jgi:hypothetical protein
MNRKRLIRLVAAALSIWPWSDAHATPPFYDPGIHCREVARQGGGPDYVYSACFRQEQAAFNRIKTYWDSLSFRTRTYCDSMAEPTSSYQVLETCLQQLGIVPKGSDAVAPKP